MKEIIIRTVSGREYSTNNFFIVMSNQQVVLPIDKWIGSLDDAFMNNFNKKLYRYEISSKSLIRSTIFIKGKKIESIQILNI
jgi:hypothetical protein